MRADLRNISYHDYLKMFPGADEQYVSFINRNSAKDDWRFIRFRSLDKLMPSKQAIENGWVIEVEDFNSPEAVKQGTTADSD